MKPLSAKRRVLFVGPYPPHFAGPHMAMKALLGSSLSDRYDIVFINTNTRRGSNEKRGSVDIIAVKAFFIFITQLIVKVFKYRPEMAYYFVTATRLGWLGRDIWCIFLSKMLVGKIVIHMRAGHFRRNMETCRGWERAIIKFSRSLVDMGIVQSNNLRDQFYDLTPENRIVAVYNGIDTRKYHNNSTEIYDHNMTLFQDILLT